MTDTTVREGEAAPKGGDVVYRHRLSTRLWHWTNAVVLLVMLMSGLMIFNAHPRLYWGQYGANPDPAWLEIGSNDDAGYLRVGDLRVETTGFLGLWQSGGRSYRRAFPGWATLPSHYDLALGRRWHLTFAWLFAVGFAAYLAASLANRHLWRDLLPGRGEVAPRNVWRDIRHHATLRFPRGEEARRYNVLQKLAYVAVLLVLIPGIILTGMTMSPALDAAFPVLLDIFGGRQSARSIHFICAFLLVAFILVHVLMVLLSGPLNQIRAMITGTYRLPEEKSR